MRGLGSTLALLAAAAAIAAPARAAEWRSQQPVGDAGFPAQLGAVGDVEFQAPNRGMLITAGNGGVAAGLFAYDGSGWYRYSTVCGGHEGRIAWAGPDEFWTISDQQAGQGTGKTVPAHISLCHFKGGQVVASYAEPIGVASSYLPMDAAACAGPSDCWFAGDRLAVGSANQGAFHLHWDGGALTATPSLTDSSNLSDPGRSVFGLAYHQGSLYESVKVQNDDVPSTEEVENEAEFGLGPSLLHRIQPGAPSPFQPLFGTELFAYGEASELQGLHLASDGQSLWAIPAASGFLPLAVLRLGPEGLSQLPLADPDSILGPELTVKGVAAEPGLGDVWVAFQRQSDSGLNSPARLARVHGDGTVDPEITLPATGEEAGGEELGTKGLAGPVACAAAEQCWIATSKGWLFHLGPDLEPNGDPALHVLVTSRPADHSLPVLPPLELPEDDSGANAGKGASDQEALPGEFDQLPKRIPPLYSKVKQRLVGDGTVLELSFTLRAKAHVRLVGRRGGRVVAATKRYTMDKGRRSVRLQLDPKRWPTKLDLQVAAAKGQGSK